MKVTTESGAIYRISSHHICTKTNHHGIIYAPFKIWTMKAIDNELVTGKDMDNFWEVVHATPVGDPEIGKRLFVAGRDEWWISTPVVSIEEDDEETP